MIATKYLLFRGKDTGLAKPLQLPHKGLRAFEIRKKVHLNRLFLLVAFAWVSSVAQAQVSELTPRPELTPEQVVQYQISALQHDDEPAHDAGIERAFRFASPKNKQNTGPLARFAQIIKGPDYFPMLHSLSSTVVGSSASEGTAAVYVRIVTPSGRRMAYVFILSKQIEGEYANCWMTDSVAPVDLGEDPSGPAVTI